MTLLERMEQEYANEVADRHGVKRPSANAAKAEPLTKEQSNRVRDIAEMSSRRRRGK